MCMYNVTQFRFALTSTIFTTTVETMFVQPNLNCVSYWQSVNHRLLLHLPNTTSTLYNRVLSITFFFLSQNYHISFDLSPTPITTTTTTTATTTTATTATTKIKTTMTTTTRMTKMTMIKMKEKIIIRRPRLRILQRCPPVPSPRWSCLGSSVNMINEGSALVDTDEISFILVFSSSVDGTAKPVSSPQPHRHRRRRQQGLRLELHRRP